MARNRGTITAAAPAAAFSGLASAAEWNARPPVTGVATEIYDLHLIMMGIVFVIFVGVFSVMFYSIWAHRKSVGHQAGQFHENIAVEIVWTVIPFLILIFMAWPATKALLNLKDTSNADITIKATGMQWKWGYDYIKGDGEGISFFSNVYAPRRQAVDSTKVKNRSYRLDVDNPVVVPVNKKIRVVLTANDEIHAWHIPALGMERDAIPGLVSDTWFKAEKIGTYRGECDGSCAPGRACALIVVKAVSDDDYKKWVDGRKKDMAAKPMIQAMPGPLQS